VKNLKVCATPRVSPRIERGKKGKNMGNRAKVSQSRAKLLLAGPMNARKTVSSYSLNTSRSKMLKKLNAQVSQSTYCKRKAVLKNECYRMAATRYEKQGYIY